MTRTIVGGKIHQTKRTGLRWSIQLEHKWPDAWIGAFWSSTRGPDHRWAVLDVWVCIIPCIPVHLFLNRKAKPL